MSDSSLTLAMLCRHLEQCAPLALAEEWDNVGLLLGDESRSIARVMTCLTLTTATVAEAIREQADLVISHHPLPFRPLKKITASSLPGRWLLPLLEARVAVYSPHTALDSAVGGINEELAQLLELRDVVPLIPSTTNAAGAGTGRCGQKLTPHSLRSVATQLKNVLRASHVAVVGEPDRTVQRVAVACGSAGSLLSAAHQAQCDLFITGETNLHTCYEAEALGIGLILAGHYATERFRLESLAVSLASSFPGLTVWASRDEREPMHFV
jgi:dinuclear metal center YbgI/SA1388 family protein